MNVVEMLKMEPVCRLGYSKEQLEKILGDDLPNFNRWMYGQTRALCEGKRWDESRNRYIQDCDGVSHGVVTYRWDIRRYLELGRGNAPIID